MAYFLDQSEVAHVYVANVRFISTPVQALTEHSGGRLLFKVPEQQHSDILESMLR